MDIHARLRDSAHLYLKEIVVCIFREGKKIRGLVQSLKNIEKEIVRC